MSIYNIVREQEFVAQHDELWYAEQIAEAKSIRYVDAARIVFLSSGYWAVFSLHGGSEPRIMVNLDPDVIKQAIKESAYISPPKSKEDKVKLSIADLEIEM